MKRTASAQGFSLIELLVVITIIATLAGLLFPALIAAMQAPKKAVAKNAGINLAIANESFRTDYGVYPDLGTTGADTFVASDNSRLMNILRARETTSSKQNPRMTQYFSYKNAKSTTKPRDGYDSTGNLLDPWGRQYKIKYDTSYDDRLMAYGEDLDLGTIVWSVGRDGVEVVNHTQLSGSDDVVTWR
jgi:prepilin-type N-terminal cleavage/methylation domain-containing protein